MPLVEVNKLGPTIQQGVIQRPVRGVQPGKETRFETQTRTVPQNRSGDNGNHMSSPEENGGIHCVSICFGNNIITGYNFLAICPL